MSARARAGVVTLALALVAGPAAAQPSQWPTERPPDPLPAREVQRPQASQEVHVGGGALHEDVLAVVDDVAGLGIDEGAGLAPGPWPALEDRHRVAEVGQLARSREPG